LALVRAGWGCAMGSGRPGAARLIKAALEAVRDDTHDAAAADS
jgi:hypothetical protein